MKITLRKILRTLLSLSKKIGKLIIIPFLWVFSVIKAFFIWVNKVTNPSSEEIDKTAEYIFITPFKWLLETIAKFFGTVLAFLITVYFIVFLLLIGTQKIIEKDLENLTCKEHFVEVSSDSIDCSKVINKYPMVQNIIQQKPFSNNIIFNELFKNLADTLGKPYFDSLVQSTENWTFSFDEYKQAHLNHKYYHQDLEKQDKIRSAIEDFILNLEIGPSIDIVPKSALFAMDYVFPPLDSKKHFFTEKDVSKAMNEIKNWMKYCNGWEVNKNFKCNFEFRQEGVYCHVVDSLLEFSLVLDVSKSPNKTIDYTLKNFRYLNFNSKWVEELNVDPIKSPHSEYVAKLISLYRDLAMSRYEEWLNQFVSRFINRIEIRDGFIEIEVKRGSSDLRVDFIVVTKQSTTLYSTPNLSIKRGEPIPKYELFYCLDQFESFFYVKNELGHEGWIKKEFVNVLN